MKIALIASTLFLVGCATTQSTANPNRIAQHYIGGHADKLFLNYGPPARQYTLSNGDKFYTWRFGVTRVPIPGSSTYQGSLGPTGQVYGTATHNPGAHCTSCANSGS